MHKRLVITSLIAAPLLLTPSTRPAESDAFDAMAAGVNLGAVMAENGCLDAEAPAEDKDVPWPPDWHNLQIAGGDVPPTRVVRDPWPTFHSVAVDTENNRVFMSDSNRHALWSYDRTAGSATSKDAVEPLTGIRGPHTGMMFVANVEVDPEKREIYSVDNDIGDRLMTYPYDGNGNIKPIRSLHVPHQAWGIALNKKRGEVAISVESSRMIVVYKLGAKDDDKPIRTLRGGKTGLGDPHGVKFDEVNDELVVANHGNISGRGARGDASARTQGGRFEEPSVTFYRADAGGDTEPVRKVQGSKSELNWPMGVSIDTKNGEVAVASSGNNSILVFSRTSSGNVAPARMIRGAKTGLNGPMGVAVDAKNDEIWVTNYGDHTALVFARTASGDVAPKRILRNAPAGAPTSGFGNPGAVAYDPKREEILVPN